MHERFHYRTKDELVRKASELGFTLPFSDDVSPLLESAKAGEFTIPNRIVVQPMEGYDSDNEGAPSELTERRYLRYSAGGSGTIWFEAVAVNHEGRSNPRQLWINRKSRDKFAFLNDRIRKNSGLENRDPFLVVQITHSGRYSKPDGKPAPRVAAPNPLLDRASPEILTDDDLRRIQDQYVSAAGLAREAGFNALDIKACHGYLMIELLAAKNRAGSIYGGEEPEKRFRFFLETYDRIRYEVPGLMVTSRLGISDMYRGGFGVDDMDQPDFTEAMMLVGQLSGRGIELLNVTMGSPYFNPHISRPYDVPLPGMKTPDEHPLQGVMRMINGTSIFQKKFPDLVIVGTAFSYLRQYAPNVGAALVKSRDVSLAGFGRNSFAYPSMPTDLMRTGRADPSKTCICCSGCTRLIRNLHIGGCVVRDKEIYGKELKKLIADGK